jgi:hypothetical protein
MVWTHVAWVAIGFAVIVTFCGLIDEASPSFPLLALSKPAKICGLRFATDVRTAVRLVSEAEGAHFAFRRRQGECG